MNKAPRCSGPANNFATVNKTCLNVHVKPLALLKRKLVSLSIITSVMMMNAIDQLRKDISSVF